MKRYNLGGMLEDMMVPAELEGGEAFETPDGNLFEIEGPKHSKGGVKMQLPEETMVYSDEIKGPDGKSMAERKKGRVKQLNKILKETDDPFNMIARNTVERTLLWAQQEEMADTFVMDLANEMDEVMKWGGKVKKYAKGGKVKKYQMGGGVDPIISAFQQLIESRKMNVDPLVPQSDLTNPSPRTPLLDQLFGWGMDDQVNPNTPPSTTDIAGGAVKGAIAAGPLGAAIGTFGPLITTLMSGLGGKNDNPYAGYGQQALGTNTQAQRAVEGARDQAISDNRLAFEDQTSRIRSGTSSASVARAATQGATANRMRQNNRATTSFSDRISRLLSERANMQLRIDDKVMGGADTATVRDTQDRDAFFTNLNQDVRTVAKGLMFQDSVGEKIDIIKLLGL